MSGEFVTWNTITNYAGAVMLTALITQFCKEIPFLKKCNTQVLSFVIAVLLLEAAMFFNYGWNVDAAVLSLINGVVVALAANGTYDAINAKAATPALKEGENNG